MARKLPLRFGMQCAAALALASAVSSAYAQITDAEGTPIGTQNQPLDGSLQGVIINRTFTVVGFDFYQYFSAAWREQEKNEKYSISIYERPTAIRGSEVWIQFGQARIFQTYLSPTRSTVKAVSLKAVEIVQKRVSDMDMQRLIFQDTDLASEELQ